MSQVGQDFFEVMQAHQVCAPTKQFLSVAKGMLVNIGLNLRIAKLAEAAAIQEQEEHWYKYPPMFDTRLSDISEDTSFALLGSNDSGVVCCSQSGRYYDTQEKTFGQIVEDHSFYYGDTFAHAEKLPDTYQTATISSPTAEHLRGGILYSGGMWVHPDYRGKGIGRILTRLVHVLGYARWNPDFIIGMTREALSKERVLELYGYHCVEPGFDIHVPNVGTQHWCLLAMTKEEHHEDIARFTMRQSQ